MSATSTSSPQRKLAMFGSVNTSPKLKSTEMSPPRSSNWLWTSPSRKSVTSPPKRVSTSPTFDLGQDSAALNGSSNNTQRRKAKHHVVHKPHVATQSPKSPTVQETQPSSLSHPADSPHWIRLGPRISNGSKSNHKHGHGACDTFFTEEPKSILHSRRYSYRHLTAGSSSSNDSSSCTMTPTVMFSTEVDHQQIQNSSKRQEQQFHQSPHWTGKVRINPFSPVPPKYLEPPSSTKSLPHMNSYFGLPVLSSKSLSPLQLPSKNSGARRSRRLKPKGGTFPPILDDNVSPTDVTEDPFGVEPSGKRKSEAVLGLPQSVSEDIEPPHKQIKLSRSRYLSDFEEVRHLGSGSFGSVNACLSRLDGCMYAIKSVSPQGIERSSLSGYSSRFDSGGLYGRSKNSSSDLPPVPPTPRRDVSLTPMRKKWFSHTAASGDTEDDSGGMASGTKHWTDIALKRMLREVHALAALCNQSDVRTFHIVRYHQAWFEDDGTLYIQTELCSSTLRDDMSNHRSSAVKESSSERAARNIVDASQQFKCLREILLALQLVHGKGMVHLDIKPDNVFVQSGLYKLGDFGLAGIATSMDVEEGDSRYMSRDMLQGGQRDLTKCDSFSLGATMYELCLGRTLPSCGEEWHDLRNGKLIKFWPPSLYQIIREMLHPDPTKRPSASDLLSRDELSCESIERILKKKQFGYNICLGESTPLKRSSSWSL